MKIEYDDPPGADWRPFYLPLPCVCGRVRLEYIVSETTVIRVRCEKCERDSSNDAWNFHTPSTGEKT